MKDRDRAIDRALRRRSVPLTMGRGPEGTRRRRLLALVLAVLAVGLVVAEPFPKGEVLVSLTEAHGIDAGDLPSLGVLVVAGWFAI
jgi:hypothetical protein